MNEIESKIRSILDHHVQDGCAIVDSFSTKTSNGKTKIVITILNKDEDGKTRYHSEYEKNCIRLGMNPVWIEKITYFRKENYKLIGLDLNKKRNCVVLLNTHSKKLAYITTNKAISLFSK